MYVCIMKEMNSMVINIEEKQRYIEELKSQLEKQCTITRTQALKIEDLKSRLKQTEGIYALVYTEYLAFSHN